MKNTLYFILTLIVTQTFISCFGDKKEERLSLEKDFKLVEINNEYSMRIPKYMKESNDLLDGASLQYANIFEEIYVVVTSENKEEFMSYHKDIGAYNDTISPVDYYADTQLKILKSGLDVEKTAEIKSLKINSLPAQIIEYDAKIPGVKYDISYFATSIEGDEKFYIITAWTLKSKKDTHRNTFEKMARSFRLLDK